MSSTAISVSGYGLNSKGGSQVSFQAPGADAKYRLGNEAETYGEFIFVNNWLNPEHNSDKAWLKTEVMIEANTGNYASYANFPGNTGNDQFRLREAFVRAGHILESQPDAKFWAGERYYRRQHIEINDFYPLDMSGYGAGVEDWNLRVGKMAVAYLAAARPDIVTQNGNYAKSNIDVRLYDLKGPFGLWGVWFDFATAKGGTTQTGTVIPTSNGYAVGLRYQRLEWHGGYHTFTIQYGKGAASNFSTSIDNPEPFLKSSERLLIAEHLLVQPNDRFAIMPIFIFQRKRDGAPGHGFNDWASLCHYTKRGQAIRWLVAQIHHCAANRSRPQVLQPARAAVVSDLCELVQRLPRSRRCYPVRGQNQWSHLRCASGNLVVKPHSDTHDKSKSAIGHAES